MTEKQVEKIVRNVFGEILLQFKLNREYFFYLSNEWIDNQISFYTKKIGGEIFLITDTFVRLNPIENKWSIYESELGLKLGVFRPTFKSTFGLFEQDKFTSLTNLGIKVGYNASDEWVKENARSIIQDYYLPFAEKLKDIQYCDQLINKNIAITEEVTRISPIDGLPFRKIFIAEAAGNPRLEEIKIAMRRYCEEQFELGIKENFEELCQIKPVFEKLFGV